MAIPGGQPVAGRVNDPQHARVVLEHLDCSRLGHVQADPVHDFFRAPVEGVQTRHRAHPKRALPVLVGRSHQRAAQTRRISRIVRVVAERPARRIQPMQAGRGGQPHDPGPILADVPDRPEDTVRTVTVDREAGRGFRGGIEPIERFAGADPEIPGPVLEKGLEKAPGRVVRVGRITTVGFELVAVVPVQHARGVEPQKPLIVLKDVADLAGGQAVLGGQMGKADVLAFAYGESHQRGFRCAQSGGKLKKAHRRRAASHPAFRAGSCQWASAPIHPGRPLSGAFSTSATIAFES